MLRLFHLMVADQKKKDASKILVSGIKVIWQDIWDQPVGYQED